MSHRYIDWETSTKADSNVALSFLLEKCCGCGMRRRNVMLRDGWDDPIYISEKASVIVAQCITPCPHSSSSYWIYLWIGGGGAIWAAMRYSQVYVILLLIYSKNLNSEPLFPISSHDCVITREYTIIFVKQSYRSQSIDKYLGRIRASNSKS